MKLINITKMVWYLIYIRSLSQNFTIYLLLLQIFKLELNSEKKKGLFVMEKVSDINTELTLNKN